MPFSATELMVIIVLILIVVGPEKMPQAAAQLGRFVRQAKVMTLDAKKRLKEELGPDLQDLDLRSLDPRQYDPRRIVRDALRDDAPVDTPAAPSPAPMGTPAAGSVVGAGAVGSAVAGGMLTGSGAVNAAYGGQISGVVESRPNPYQFQPGSPSPFDTEAT
ncbi:MAG: twin-arginine translocase TatA/TatE family subunit [Bowdeniella nasicola]|nr:twin-arginine translocase TatA/TatE family subunit [Bowdeniella nasicola]